MSINLMSRVWGPIPMPVEDWLEYKRFRGELYKAHDGRCWYCGEVVDFASFLLSHQHPICRGGLTVADNLVVACHSCTSLKGGRTVEEYRVRLNEIPARPFRAAAEALLELRDNQLHYDSPRRLRDDVAYLLQVLVAAIESRPVIFHGERS